MAGFIFYFEAIRTASSDCDAPRRFSLLLVNTFAWLYNQQEQLYVSLFAEVSVAKALLEQIAYVSRGRPEYAAELLENVRRYVDDDLTKLSAEPVTALLGGSSASYADPLEQVLARRGYLKPSPPRHRRNWSRVCSMAWRLTKSRAIILRSHQCAIAASGPRRAQVMWLTSVGSPGDVYETVRSLREARGQRLGALQRKLPAAHFGLLAVLGVLVLAIFPLLAAATGAAVAPEDGLLRVQAVLFGLMTFAIAVAVCVEIIYLRRALHAVEQAQLSIFVTSRRRRSRWPFSMLFGCRRARPTTSTPSWR